MDPLDNDFDSDKIDGSIDDLLKNLPLDVPKMESTESSISEDIKQILTESHSSDKDIQNVSLERNCLAKSLEVTEIPKTELYETGVPSISDHSVKFSVTKSPLNSPTHISKEFSPEVTFELQLSPEIKFNVSEVDLENESLNEVDFSNATKYNRKFHSLVCANEKKIELIKKSRSLDEATIPTVPMLNLKSVMLGENSKADEQNENERVFETISVKDDINTPKTISQCQYSFSNVDPQNLDLNNSGCDGNLMQSLLNSIDTGTTSTEYKALCEEFTARQNFDYQSALNEKDEFIQTLTKSLQESMEVQKELNKDVSNLHNELDQLRTKLAEVERAKTSSKESPSTESMEDKKYNEDVMRVLQSAHISRVLVNSELQKFAKDLTPIQRLEFDDIKYKFEILLKHEKDELKQEYEEQIRTLQDTLKNEKQELENEISRLRQALCEFKDSGTDILQIKEHLQEQHKKEVEDLRTYFEKKCADMEKHYSEEIFSQQSQRVSVDSSLDGDIGDLLYNPDIPEKYQGNNVISTLESDEQGAGDAANANLEPAKTLAQNTNFNNRPENNQNWEVLQNSFNESLSQITGRHASHLKTIELHFICELAALKFNMLLEQDPKKVDDLIQEILDQAEHQLQEQVETVRLDILGVLEQQLKTLQQNLSSGNEAQVVDEMTQIKDKKSEDPQIEIMKLKTSHQNEILKLRNDHEKQLNRKLQRNTTFDKNRDLGEVFKERNSLRKVNRTLHLLITELISYVSDCETEINNAFWSKLENLEQICDNTVDESIQNATISSDLNQSCITKVGERHVHFAPDISQFLDQLKDDSILQNLELEKSVTVDLKTELNNCLDRLKSEASALLQLTNTTKAVDHNISCNINDEKIMHLKNLDGILSHVEELEKEKQEIIAKLIEVQGERDDLKVQLATATSKNEIISEGYGGHSPIRNLLVKQSTFAELRQRATLLLSSPMKESSDMVNTPLLQLFEDLCREGDRMYEESTQDREDLQLQIEAADKQLRSTRQFLEDQAAEREQERDDFTREISELKAKLKDRDKERHVHGTALKEIEQLESQMREMTLTIAQDAKTKENLESELKASVDKICLLSDIIRELENQLEAKSLNEKNHEKQILDLHNVNEEQNKKYESLAKEFITAQHQSDVQTLNEKISNLEDQLHNHRQTTENTTAILEVKKQLDDIGSCIDLKTKQLEALHAAVYSTSCSSEDVSMGDRKLGRKNNFNLNDESSLNESSPVDILDHLQHIQEKLTRHWRVEEAVLKQIRDLEMQIAALKHTCSELKNERDLLHERSQQQIIDLSSLQSRLDDQRRRADSIHKQSTSDLHLQIHNLQSDLASTKEQLINKNRRIQNLEHIVEESRIKTTPDNSRGRDMTKLSEEVHVLFEENRQLRERLENEEIVEKSARDFIDIRIEEKDAEINALKERLDRTVQELEIFLQLQLSDEEIRKLKMLKEKKDKQNGTKLSARTLSDIVSISDYDELDVMRKDDTRFEGDLIGSMQKPDMNYSPPFTFNQFNMISNDDIQFRSLTCNKNLTDVAANEKSIGQGDGSPVLQQKLDLIPENEECSISEKNIIQFQLQNEIEHLKILLENKIEELASYKQQLTCIPLLEEEMQKLQENLQDTLKTIEDDKIKFEKIIQSENENKKIMQNMQVDLMKKYEENNNLIESNKQKDQELRSLALEKQDIQKMLDDLAAEYKNYDQVLQENKNLKDKICEIDSLQIDLSQKQTQIEKHQKDLLAKDQELLTLRDYTELLKETIKEKVDLLNELNQEIGYHQGKIKEQNNLIDKLTHELSNFKHLQNTPEFANEDLENVYKNELKDRDEQILHFKELLEEKEKIIDHISKDSDNLHAALATIQNKLKESGNILDLAMKLKNELKKNELLAVEVEQLRKVVTRVENNASPQQIDDIEKQVQRELDESIKLDNSLIKVIENDDFISDDNEQVSTNKRLTTLLSQNEVLQTKLDEEVKRNVKLMVSKQTLLLELKNLEDKLRKEEEINTNLHKELQQEMNKNNEIQMQDAAIMEAMRLRLENALDKENMLKRNLIEKVTQNEKITGKELKVEFSSDKSSNEMHEELLAELKSLKKELSVQYDVSDKLTSELVVLKAQVNSEKNKLHEAEILIAKERVEFKYEVDNKNRLIGEIKNDLGRLKEQKAKLVRELYETNQRSIQQCDRIASLESQLKTIQLTEMRRNQNRGKEKEEQLATTIKNQQLHTQTTFLESRLSSLQNELDRAIECENVVRKALNDRKMSTSTELLSKLKEVSTFLEEHAIDNKNIPNKLEGLEYVSFDSYQNALEKVNHFFTKCMRSESYRKALTWQKDYLMRVQKSYEVAERKAIAGLNMTIKKRNLSPIQKFRTAVFTVIAISRMQYLVKRWDAGKTTVGRVSHSSKFYKNRLRGKTADGSIQKHAQLY